MFYTAYILKFKLSKNKTKLSPSLALAKFHVVDSHLATRSDNPALKRKLSIGTYSLEIIPGNKIKKN